VNSIPDESCTFGPGLDRNFKQAAQRVRGHAAGLHFQSNLVVGLTHANPNISREILSGECYLFNLIEHIDWQKSKSKKT